MLALSVVLFMLLMRRETFHGVNRVLLLAVVLLSLLFPVVEWEVNTPMARVMGSVEQMVMSADATVAVGQPLAVAVDAPTDASPNGGEQTGVLHYIMYIYLAGVLMLAVRLIYMYIQVACLVRRGKHEDASPYTTQRLRLMVHEGDSRPFSWFGIVSISRTDLAEAIHTMLTTDGPYLLEVAIMQGENVMPMTPPGGAVNVMMMNATDC